MSQVYQVNVGISEFRANMSSFLKQVKAGNVIHLMSHGEEIAKLVPPDYAQKAARQELALLRETAVLDDVISPINESWSADR